MRIFQFSVQNKVRFFVLYRYFFSYLYIDRLWRDLIFKSQIDIERIDNPR